MDKLQSLIELFCTYYNISALYIDNNTFNWIIIGGVYVGMFFESGSDVMKKIDVK